MQFLLDNDVPDAIARVLVEAGHGVLLLRDAMPIDSSDEAVFDYAVAKGLLLITCNRDHFMPLARGRRHSGLIILVRRQSRRAECAKLLRLVESATETGLTANINFA